MSSSSKEVAGNAKVARSHSAFARMSKQAVQYEYQMKDLEVPLPPISQGTPLSPFSPRQSFRKTSATFVYSTHSFKKSLLVFRFVPLSLGPSSPHPCVPMLAELGPRRTHTQHPGTQHPQRPRRVHGCLVRSLRDPAHHPVPGRQHPQGLRFGPRKGTNSVAMLLVLSLTTAHRLKRLSQTSCG